MIFDNVTYDNCQLCHGRSLGTPGNENVLKIGEHLHIVVCDYCDVALHDWAQRVIDKRNEMKGPRLTNEQLQDALDDMREFIAKFDQANPLWSGPSVR